MWNFVFDGILLIFFVITCSASYQNPFRPDYFYDGAARGWLKFHQMPLSWEDAVLTCFYEDSIIASPINDGISKALGDMMAEYELVAPMFTGISNTYTNSVYQSMEGVALSKIGQSWSPNPHRQASENCIAFNPNGTLTEVSCADRRPFACFKTEANVKAIKSCGTLDTEYKLNEKTGSCYKLHKVKHTWPEAYRICAAEGGHLAIVNSQAEAEVIWDMGIKSGSDYALGLGFHEWGHDRTWITIKGQSLQDAGYDKWYTGEPNILAENCSSFMTDGNPKDVGILADLPCHVKVMFICEIELCILSKLL